MKLLTLNTHSLIEGRGEEQASVLSEAILTEKFDVIALQEVNQPKENAPISEGSAVKRGNFAAKVLETLSAAGVTYHFFYLPIKLGYEKYDEGLAFLCRAPIAEVETFALTEGYGYENWRRRAALGIRCEGSDEWFFNLHMGWWDDTEEPFFSQWVRLLRHLLPKKDYWLMGDFNNPAEVRGEGYDLLRESGLHDAYEMARHRQGEGTARAKIDGWRGRASASEWLRIDQIWSSRARSVEVYRTLFDGKNFPVISDHLGVSVTVNDPDNTDQKEKL